MNCITVRWWRWPKSVTVMRREGLPMVFTSSSAIPLSTFGGGELAVGEGFA